MTQFRRSASLTIGKPNALTAIVIRNLKIVFTIEKTEGKDPNTAKVEIFNLAESTRKKIETEQLGDNLIVYAGYLDGEGEQLIFSGDIKSVTHQIKRPNVITTIMANDGANSLGTAKISLAKNKGVTARSILESILKTFPLPNNLKTISIPAEKTYSNGFAFTGMSKDALTKVTEFLDLDWTIQNNEIRLSPFDGNDSSEAVLLNIKTGLLDSPSRIVDETKKAKGETSKDKPGWQLKSLLSPKINPKGQVSVSSREIPDNTFFNVHSVIHRGDTHGSDWISEIEVHDQ